MTVWIYVDTARDVGDADHLKVFASEATADAWFSTVAFVDVIISSHAKVSAINAIHAQVRGRRSPPTRESWGLPARWPRHHVFTGAIACVGGSKPAHVIDMMAGPEPSSTRDIGGFFAAVIGRPFRSC
jgi:hypothetical protein